MQAWASETRVPPRSREWCPDSARSAGLMKEQKSQWERETHAGRATAAVDGYAVGGCLEIRMACDFVIATSRKARLIGRRGRRRHYRQPGPNNSHYGDAGHRSNSPPRDHPVASNPAQLAIRYPRQRRKALPVDDTRQERRFLTLTTGQPWRGAGVTPAPRFRRTTRPYAG